MRRLSIAICAGSLLFLSAQPSRADYVQPQRFSAGRLSVDTSTGARCSSDGADRASASVIATQRDGDARAAAVISIPFGGPSQSNCNELLAHETARSRLELAAQLFEAGALSPEEFKAIADDVASLIR